MPSNPAKARKVKIAPLLILGKNVAAYARLTSSWYELLETARSLPPVMTTEIFWFAGSIVALSLHRPLGPGMECSTFIGEARSTASSGGICGSISILLRTRSSLSPSMHSENAHAYSPADHACSMQELKGSGLS